MDDMNAEERATLAEATSSLAHALALLTDLQARLADPPDDPWGPDAPPQPPQPPWPTA